MNNSFNQKRLGAAVVGLLTLASLANHYFELGFYPRFSKGIVIGAFVFLFLYLSFVGPHLDEIIEFRRNADARTQESGNRAPKLYILTLVVVSASFVLIGPIQKLMRGDVVKMRDWIQLLFLEVLVILAGIWGWYQYRQLRDRKSGSD